MLINMRSLCLSLIQHSANFTVAIMALLTIMKCPCLRWPLMCSACCSHNHFPSIITYHEIWLTSVFLIRVGGTRMTLAESTCPSKAHDFTPCFLELGFLTSFCPIICHHVFSFVLCCPQQCPRQNVVRFVFTFVGGSFFIYHIGIYLIKLVSNTISISGDVRVV